MIVGYFLMSSDCWLLGRSKISAPEEYSATWRGIARSMVQAKCEAQDKDSLHYRPIYQHKGDDMEACWGRNECRSAEHVSWGSCIPSEGHWSGERVQCSIKGQCDCNHAWYQGKLYRSLVEFLVHQMGEVISCWGTHMIIGSRFTRVLLIPCFPEGWVFIWFLAFCKEEKKLCS